MNAYYTIGLVGFVVVSAVVLVRYVNALVDRQFRSLARASTDAGFRHEEMKRLDGLLAGALPLPESVRPLPAGRGGVRAILPPVLLTVGVILLWGGGAEHEDRSPWLYGGVAAIGVATVCVLATLGRRKWARTARLLLFRADLRRMDGDRSGAAADLRELMRLTPSDDSAWAELSDDLASCGDYQGALSAMEKASSLDPGYDEYHMLQTSLALRLNRFDRAQQAVDTWLETAGVDADDPRVAIYKAAIALGEGKRDEAENTVRRIARECGPEELEFLDADGALEGVRGLV